MFQNVRRRPCLRGSGCGRRAPRRCVWDSCRPRRSRCVRGRPRTCRWVGGRRVLRRRDRHGSRRARSLSGRLQGETRARGFRVVRAWRRGWCNQGAGLKRLRRVANAPKWWGEAPAEPDVQSYKPAPPAFGSSAQRELRPTGAAAVSVLVELDRKKVTLMLGINYLVSTLAANAATAQLVPLMEMN